MSPHAVKISARPCGTFRPSPTHRRLSVGGPRTLLPVLIVCIRKPRRRAGGRNACAALGLLWTQASTFGDALPKRCRAMRCRVISAAR